MISIAIEIQKLVSVANVCLTMKDRGITPSLLTVENDSLAFSLSENDEDFTFRLNFPNLNQLELEPTTLCNLMSQVFTSDSIKELGFRVNVKSEILGLINPDDIAPKIVEHQSENKFCFCVCCGCKIGHIDIKRVVEMPSSNWRELASEWFCHKHSSCDNDGDALGNLDFKSGDFVNGPTQIYFQTSCLSQSGELILSDKGAELRCPRCLSSLGYVSLSPLNNSSTMYCCFLKHTLVFNAYDSLPPEFNSSKELLNDIIATILLKEYSPMMTTKFCFELEKPLTDSKCLLIWVMDRNLPRFHMAKDVVESCVIEIQLRSVLKVLYSLVKPDSAKCHLWKKTFECEVEIVSPRTLWDTVALLKESTETVPQTQRIIDDFVVGFFNHP